LPSDASPATRYGQPEMNDDDLPEILNMLKAEHRRLDAEIDIMRGAGNCDPLELARMKKRKLGLKDEIQSLSDRLVPDILA
jgi:hypothetical protein